MVAAPCWGCTTLSPTPYLEALAFFGALGFAGAVFVVAIQGRQCNGELGWPFGGGRRPIRAPEAPGSRRRPSTCRSSTAAAGHAPHRRPPRARADRRMRR